MDLYGYFELLKEHKHCEAEKLRQLTIPNKLIKFVSLDGSDNDEKKFKSLENDEMWFSHKRLLNDPYEFKGLFIDKGKMRDIGYEQSNIDEYLKLFDMNEYGVSCLSANHYDYLPMWAYYTNNHKGYCIEYDVIHKEAIHEVIYEQDRIDVTDLVIQYSSIIKSNLQSGDINKDKTDYYIKVLMMNFYMKAQSWSHEKEFRIVHEIDDDTGKNVKVNKFGLRTNRIIAGIECSEASIERLSKIADNLGLEKLHRCKLLGNKYSVTNE